MNCSNLITRNGHYLTAVAHADWPISLFVTDKRFALHSLHPELVLIPSINGFIDFESRSAKRDSSDQRFLSHTGRQLQMNKIKYNIFLLESWIAALNI